jgi:hypothetical protein
MASEDGNTNSATFGLVLPMTRHEAFLKRFERPLAEKWLHRLRSQPTPPHGGAQRWLQYGQELAGKFAVPAHTRLQRRQPQAPPFASLQLRLARVFAAPISGLEPRRADAPANPMTGSAGHGWPARPVIGSPAQRSRRPRPAQSSALPSQPRSGCGPDSEAGQQPTAVRRNARLAERIERSSPIVVERRVTDWLTRMLHIRLPEVSIYANQAADQLVRSAGADALAYPDLILFRNDTYDPDSAEGLALLGHELTHVQQMRQRAFPKAPAASTTLAAEEHEAIRNERAVLYAATALPADQDGPPAPARTPWPATTVQQVRAPLVPPAPAIGWNRGTGGGHPANVAAAPAAVERGGGPRAAAHSRDLGPPPEAPAAVPSAAQLQQIKAEIYRDLIDQIRSDFERGA